MRAIVLFFALILNGVLPLQTANAKRTDCENGWCWGDEPRKTKEKYALFADGLLLGDFKRSEAAFNWLIDNVPELNEELYIKGEKLFVALLENEKQQGTDKATIDKYNNKIQELRKLREKYFPG